MARSFVRSIVLSKSKQGHAIVSTSIVCENKENRGYLARNVNVNVSL